MLHCQYHCGLISGGIDFAVYRAALSRGDEELLKKVYRLRRREDFNFTYKNGRSVSDSRLVLIVAKSRQSEVRVGFSVSKKYGKAVQRNLFKRRLREIIKPYLPMLPGHKNLIFLARKGTSKLGYAELEQSVGKLLVSAHLINEAGEK